MHDYVKIELYIGNTTSECEQAFNVGYAIEDNTNWKSLLNSDVEILEFTAVLIDEFGQDNPVDCMQLLFNSELEELVKRSVVEYIQDSYLG